MKYHLPIVFILLISALSYGQEQEMPNLKNGTIEEQFEYITKKSSNYQDYKVIRKAWVSQLKTNVIDSISTIKATVENQAKTIALKDKKIATFENELNQTKQELQQKIDEKDSISFFGTTLSKSYYKAFVWITIGIFILIIIYILIKLKTNQATTNQAKEALERVEKEYDEHRKIALEREQKVRRQLQDEINKQKNK